MSFTIAKESCTIKRTALFRKIYEEEMLMKQGKVPAALHLYIVCRKRGVLFILLIFFFKDSKGFFLDT